MIRKIGILMLAAVPWAAAESLSYTRDVRPILSKNCFPCHGPDKEHQEADLRLDIAGDVDFDEMVARIETKDPDDIMPPPKSHKVLKPEEIGLLKEWIAMGAPYEAHWAFVVPKEREVPVTGKTDWGNGAIDRFVLASLEEKNLEPSGEADKRTLIRRVTFDLTGLPPTLEEIQEFLGDDSADAYAKLVERLMAKPQYGEHMTKYWLDLVRFADTNGIHHDHYRESSPYRDWVIRSFNDNLPFDDFVKYQIAGDLYPEPTTDQLIASGFNRLHLIIDVGTMLPEESFYKNVVDRVAAVGTAFMGLTLQCAVCHDHKYDPITQKDFYQMYAFFNNFDGTPETGRRAGTNFRRGMHPPFLELPSPEQEVELEKRNGLVSRLEADLDALRKKTAKDAPELKAVEEELTAAKKNRDALIYEIPATLIMKEREEVRPAHILIRGAYDNPGEEVQRDTPGFLPPLPDTEGPPSRMDLAEWLVDPGNPLTARVAVNRFWQQFFGVGIVKTSEDFGAQGEWPSHPELLDFLTMEFVEGGWDVKALVRSIVMSKTYRQSSVAPRTRFIADPENRQLARGSRFRLDSEMIRDQILAVSGLLNRQMFGKSVKAPQPDGLWKIVAMPGSYPRAFVPATGDQAYRRSVYSFWKRGLPPPVMTIFDAPTREACISRRERTNTPLQALLLMNEEQFFEAAMNLAKNLLAAGEGNDEQLVGRAYEMVTSQLPSGAAVSQLSASRREFLELYQSDPKLAAVMIETSKDPEVRAITDPAKQAELASWTMLVHALLNLDETKTRN